MIDAEYLAKYPDAKVAAPGNQFDHHPTNRPDLGDVPPGKTAPFQAGI
jgi:hypothetical protein